jgi:cytosine deaminase
MGLSPLGTIAEGAEARLVLFTARTLNELLSRPQADRLVLDRGRPIEGGLPGYEELDGLLAG